MNARIDVPTDENGAGTGAIWGSDVIAEAVAGLQLPYLCMVPGASYRGLHDSLVNHLGDRAPQFVLCLHEMQAVSIAHGYAKATDRPLGVLLHSNVGLINGALGLFNMWCDRMPAVAIGATGPLDAEKRRPWIEWIHTSIDQGALVRNFTKWDDQPGSVGAVVEALRRGRMIASERPCGPVYVNIDSTLQETLLPERPQIAPAESFAPPEAAAPSQASLAAALDMIAAARRPVILCGRGNRSLQAWNRRVAFAERLGARVFVEYNSAATFPRRHGLHAATLKFTLDAASVAALATADLVIALDWTDPGGTIEQVWGRSGPRPAIVLVGNDHHIHRGWNMDYQRFPPADLRLAVTPEAFVEALLPLLPEGAKPPPEKPALASPARSGPGPATLDDLAAAFSQATEGMDVTLVSHPLGWPVERVPTGHPLDFLGSNGGGGLGAGPGIAIGAALALKDHAPGRLAAAILGDGDTLMGINALWTAAAMDIPVLIVVANNRSYYNDEAHQAQTARLRGRPVERAGIGTRIEDPPPDIAAAARAFGVAAEGPVRDRGDLAAALRKGVGTVRRGKPFLIDVVIPANGH